MAYAGQTIENAVTGERVTFLATAAETDGEVTVAEVAVRPGGAVAAAHVHPKQEERFEITSGTLGMKLGKRTLVLGAGNCVVVRAGTAHKFWNAGDDELRFRVEVRPALEWEQLLETMFALAADGKTTRSGMPNPVRLAVIAKHHFDDVRLPGLPAWLQRTALALGARVGRLAGYRPTYAPATRVPALAEV